MDAPGPHGIARGLFRHVASAGVAYFAVVFAAGFALGILRVTTLAPWIGETAAVVAELPIMLALSWVACGEVVRRRHVVPAVSARLVMGGVAFALLMIAEAALSVFVAGRTFIGHLALYREGPALLGLAGQIAFGLFPLVRLRRGVAG